MNKLKNVVSRFFILFICIGLVISYNSCASDQKDKDLISIQTFLEKHDGTIWTVIEKDMRIFLRLNDDKDKDLEMWVSDMGLAELMAHKECFYYSKEKLNTEEEEEEEEDLENFGNKLVFTDLDNETWTFSMDGKRLKLEFKSLNNVREPVYFSKAIENVGKLDICPDENSKAAFDWRLLK